VGVPKTLRIIVAVPSHDVVPVLWAHDFANLASYSAGVFTANVFRDPEMEFQFGLALQMGTYLHEMRNEVLAAALESGATHLLWIDSDMRFPKESLLRLLGHNKAMVGINYSQRGLPESGRPPDFVAIKDIEGAKKLRTTEVSAGLEKVESLGFGLVLMDLRRLAPKLGERPWFDFARRPGGQLIGEDVFFCQKLTKAGVSIYVDHDLSRECAHIGSFEYRTTHAALREAPSGTDN